MSIPLDPNYVDKDDCAEFEFICVGGIVEPESESSPRGNIQDGIIPSFASTVSERDYPQYVGNVSRGPRETTSWNSAATDFDDLTSPGARAEQNDQYIEAVYGSRHTSESASKIQGVPSTLGMSYLNARPWSSQNTLPVPPFMPHSAAHGLQAQADELDRAAEQLMAAAMQAKAAATQIKSQGPTVPAGHHAAIEAGKSHRGLLGPKSKNKTSNPSQVDGGRTTIMLRNLPNDYTRDMVLELLDANDFLGCYDFVYVPIDFKRQAGLGYAFVNMVNNQVAQRAFASLQGFSAWQFTSSKILEVAWGEPLQGLAAHIDRYRNSPVMHDDVPDEFRPLLFQNGFRIPFPQPTKKLQKPRMKAGRTSDAQ